MAVTDLWHLSDRRPCSACRLRSVGSPSSRHGRGRRYRVTVAGHPSRAFAVRAEAEAWERELGRRGLRPGGSVLVSELVPLWLAGKAGLSARGLTACKGDASHVLATWGSREAGTISRHEVQAWIAGLTVQVRRRSEGETGWVTRPASEALRRRLLQCLAGSLHIAVEAEMLESNPCALVTVPRAHRREARFLSVAELSALAEKVGPRYTPLIWLLGTTGLRIGEACALLVADVDVKRGRLRVRRAKGGRGRDVAIPASVLALLPLNEGRKLSEPLFTNRDGGRVDQDHFRSRVWRRALDALGWEGVRIHDLRHTAASLAIASGADVKAVQSMLGHASATLTLDTYGHLLDSRLDDVAGRMERGITGFLPAPGLQAVPTVSQ